MKLNKEVLEVKETYTIGENDTLKIDTKGMITDIFINNKEIKFVTKYEVKQETGGYAKLKVSRYFMQEDYKKLEPYYKEKEE